MADAALQALASFLDPSMLIYLLAGVVSGLVIGIIPGLGGTAAVALLLPFVFILEANQAMALLIGAVAVVHTADTISSVLLGIPGSASASVLLLDGHPMARKGKAAKALSIAFISSVAGGLLGAIGLTLTIPIARPLVLSFGAPELFMLTVVGIAMTAILSQANIVRGLLAGAFGVLLGQVGAAPAAPDYRYTFDSVFLLDGLELVAVALGIFAVSEVISSVARRGAIAQGGDTSIGTGWAEGPREVARHWRHVLRGAFVGIWTGVLPGLGATATTWIAYGQAKATARGKDKKKFGKGDPRGVVAPESAVNSGDAGDLIPTLLFGIPGAAPAAILLGALLTFGIEPGPRMITNNLDTVYTIIWSFVLATVLGAALAFMASVPLARLSHVPFPILAGGLVVILLLAGFQEIAQLPILWLMLILGVVGWIMKRTNVPRASFLIGFVLSVPLERYYFLTERLYEIPDWTTRPGVLALAALLIIPFILMIVRKLRGRGATDSDDGDDDGDDEAGEYTDTPASGTLASNDAAGSGADGSGVASSGVASTDLQSSAKSQQSEDEVEGGAPPSWTIGISVAFLLMFAGAFVMGFDYSDRARLVPQLVSAVGFALSLAAIVLEIRQTRRKPASYATKAKFRAELGHVLYVIAWIVGLIVLVYVLGLFLAALVFLPVFLRWVAGMRWWTIAIYTVIVLIVLITLRELAHVTIPIGYLTPEGLI